MNAIIMTKKKDLAEIAEKYGLDMVVLFGSQATGRTHSKSDVDIGFTAPEHLELKTRFEIETLISKVLGRDDVELVDLQRISPVMKKIVADEGVVLYEREPGMFELFCIYAFKLFVETKPLRDLRYQSLKNFAYGTTR
jgi:predicted nucleotidyltransferase